MLKNGLTKVMKFVYTCRWLYLVTQPLITFSVHSFPHDFLELGNVDIVLSYVTQG